MRGIENRAVRNGSLDGSEDRVQLLRSVYTYHRRRYQRVRQGKPDCELRPRFRFVRERLPELRELIIEPVELPVAEPIVCRQRIPRSMRRSVRSPAANGRMPMKPIRASSIAGKTSSISVSSALKYAINPQKELDDIARSA